MRTKLLQTEDDKALTTARILLGLMFFVRGAQGLLGWFGGAGFSASLDSLIHFVSIPAPLVLLAVVTDFFGGIALLAGLFTRIAALGIAVDAVVTFVLWGIGQTVYTDWLIIQGGAGGEYYVLAFALALILAFQGAGAFSLDRLLFRRALRASAKRVEKFVVAGARSEPEEHHSMNARRIQAYALPQAGGGLETQRKDV